MPNHCENDLYISGPVGEVNALLICIGADKEPPDFNFSAVIPYPEEFAKMDREMGEMGIEKFLEKHGGKATDGFNSGGYEWCIENWGTKWSAYEVTTRKVDDDNTIVLTFQTAWAPPSPVIAALHKKFPAVARPPRRINLCQCPPSAECAEVSSARRQPNTSASRASRRLTRSNSQHHQSHNKRRTTKRMNDPLTKVKTIGPFTIYARTPKPLGQTKYLVKEAGKETEMPFGRLSVAVRWCKQRVPKKPPHIVLFDDKSAVSTSPINYTVLDGPHRHDAAAAVDPAMVAGIIGIKTEQQK